MTLQPHLANAVVTLRPLAPADREPLYAAAADPAIWALHPAHDRWQRPVFDAYFDQGLASCGQLVVLDTATGAVIGSSRYDRSRVGFDDEVEIGWTFLVRSHWGGPTNRAMKQLMVGHALTGYRQVLFVVGQGNLRSRGAMVKLGATLTDRTQEIEMVGNIVRHVLFTLDRAGFDAGPLGQPL